RAWRMRTLGWGALVMPLVAVVVVVLLWPRLWGHPAAALAESLKKLGTLHPAEPFLGTSTNTPPGYYFFVYLYATAPIGVLVGIVLFAWRAFVERRFVAPMVAILMVLTPLVVAFSPVRQDGVRYVIPSVAALALLAAIGFDFAVAKLARWRRPAIAVLAGYFIVVLVRIHPYGLDYFGEQVGGAGTVERRRWFETAWWGEGLGEALAYVNAHAAPNARVYRDCIVPGHLAWFRADLWATVPHDPLQATWIVAYAPATTPCSIPKDATLKLSVEVDGAILARVYQR
ncbi:MAG: hypothetical protein NT062_35605, partial [Proteobacteria bacterium]|nr:hypothetical protein [Pseudomonadota bacterium]